MLNIIALLTLTVSAGVLIGIGVRAVLTKRNEESELRYDIERNRIYRQRNQETVL